MTPSYGRKDHQSVYSSSRAANELTLSHYHYANIKEGRTLTGKSVSCMHSIFDSFWSKTKMHHGSPVVHATLASSLAVPETLGKKCSGQPQIHLWLESGPLPVQREGCGHRGLLLLRLCTLPCCNAEHGAGWFQNEHSPPSSPPWILLGN